MSGIRREKVGRLICAGMVALALAAGARQTRAYTITQLTREPSYEGQPTWSPDGNEIAFVSDRDGNREIYVMDANGSNQKRLTTNNYDDTTPAWSPDGNTIAFTSGRKRQPEVYLMDSTGSNQRRVTVSEDIINPPWVWSGYPYSTSPAWSADASKMAFEAGFLWDNGSVSSDIYILDISDNTVRKVSNDGFNPATVIPWVNRDCSPSLSPDGDRIVYVIHKLENGIKVKNVESADPNDRGYLVLGDHPCWAYDVEWSPKGDNLIFTMGCSSGIGIYVVTVDSETGTPTDEATWLTFGAHDSDPSWSADGTKIVFGYNGDIWVMSGISVREKTLDGDLNSDGIVDFLDLSILMEQWLMTESWYFP